MLLLIGRTRMAQMWVDGQGRRPKCRAPGAGQWPLHQPAWADLEDGEVRQSGKAHQNFNCSTGSGDRRALRFFGRQHHPLDPTIGAKLDALRKELHYCVDNWLKGPSLADGREGRVSIVYTRDPGPARGSASCTVLRPRLNNDNTGKRDGKRERRVTA
jgi:hypothetical protein